VDGAFAVEWTVAYAPPIGADCRVLHGAGRGAIGLAACNCAKVGVVAICGRRWRPQVGAPHPGW